jgi:hypothetical protein
MVLSHPPSTGAGMIDAVGGCLAARTVTELAVSRYRLYGYPK